MRRYKWKKILNRTGWGLAGMGTIILLGAAMQNKDHKQCTDTRIEITGVERHMFIDEKDVMAILNAAGPVTGNNLSAINLRAMESVVEKNPWVKNAEMFLDNNRVLQVRLEERQPVARVFTLAGSSFYLDSSGVRLPLSEKISARVPVFTGFPSDKKMLAKPDSALLRHIVEIGQYILMDSFWMAQVAQVNINAQASFELIPVIGDHLIALGSAEDLDRKFRRLYAFYQQAWLQNGINTYEKIDVQYSNQVVAVKRGTAKAMFDSARAREVLQGILLKAQAGLKDSIGGLPVPAANSHNNIVTPVAPAVAATVIHKSFKRKTAPITNNKGNIKALSNGKKSKGVIRKPVIIKSLGKSTQPKAIMKSK